jgi:hypothetical protein
VGKAFKKGCMFRPLAIKIVIQIILLLSFSLQAQQPLSRTVTIRSNKLPMSFSVFAEEVQRQAGVRIFYHPSWIAHVVVNQPYENLPIGQVLNQLFAESDISFAVLADYGIILVKNSALVEERNRLLEEAVFKKKTIERIVIGQPAMYSPGKKVELTGTIIDEKTGIPVNHATIEVPTAQTGVTTNEKGQFILELAAGMHVINIRHTNYAEKVIDLEIYKNGKMETKLEERPLMLEEVVITDQSVLNSGLTTVNLRVQEMKRVPVFLGEVDILRQLQTQAGVTSVGELAGGFNVRGGSPDQNLILYDGVPVFNTSHALGFFSAFNADAVQRLQFFKGTVPAEYGGRASSVLDVTSREGDFTRWGGSGGIGFLSSYFTLNGPIQKNTTSLLASFRSTYSGWILDMINSNYASLSNALLSFYDGSVKLSHKLSETSQLTFSGYISQDRMRLITDTLFQWNNALASMILNTRFRNDLYFTMTAGLGYYRYRVEEPAERDAFDLAYSMLYPTLRADFNYGMELPLNFGMQLTGYRFQPGTLRPIHENSSAEFRSVPKEQAWEVGFYAGKSLRINARLQVDAGLRYVLYARTGPATVYRYLPGFPLEPEFVHDSTRYGPGSIVRLYHGPEPRLSTAYKLNPKSSVKLGYSRIHQFVHLISNTVAITPADIWKLSDTYIRPQRTDQITAGYFRQVAAHALDLSAEVFFRLMANVIDFKDGASLILNDKLETALLRGSGRAYGLELSAARNHGRLQGHVNYTWSRTLRSINGTFDSEKLNNGSWFPANFDQPHIFNLSWKYGISRRHYFSGNFTYRTGRPVSLPAHVYYIDGIAISDFPERNTYRLPDYHRLDVAFVIEGNHKRKKLWDGTWIVSFYNLYARKNAYSVFFRQNEWGVLKPYQLAVVGTIVPTVTYMFKF